MAVHIMPYTPCRTQVYIDTTGWAFTYPLAWRAGSRVACYVHYPTISTDMLGRVWQGTATYNNDADIAGEGRECCTVGGGWLKYGHTGLGCLALVGAGDGHVERRGDCG